MSYPSILPVKPDVDMVILPRDTVVANGSESADTITTDTVSFLTPVQLGTAGDPITSAPSLQVLFECSFAPSGASLDLTVGSTVDGTTDGITTTGRPLIAPAVPNWFSMSQTLVLFKDTDYVVAEDGTITLTFCLCGGTTEASPIIAGTSLGWSYTITPVFTV
jgi:hypothetical protein